MSTNDIIGKTEICALIPHAGNMCLLDEVTEWDDKYIVCSSTSHQDSNNPLRNNSVLPVTALIEYGAQAMAVHGGLLAKQKNESMQQGYLAALRDVSFEEDDVSCINVPLCIEANQQMASQGNMIYHFSIKADEKELLSGRATVVAIFDHSADQEQ